LRRHAPQRRARRAARGPAPQPQPARAARGAAPAARAAAVGRALDIEDRGHPAWQRIKLDELLAQQISLRRAYAARRAKNAPGCRCDTLTRDLLGQLPFALTGAQARAFAEIARDLASDHPMQRLLQGDVGSARPAWPRWPCCRPPRTAARRC
jgi:RecG-like helicase